MVHYEASAPFTTTEVRDGPLKEAVVTIEALPMLLTTDDVAMLLRTTQKAVYSMVARRQLPGVVRVGRRLLVRRDDLLDWLRQKSTPSPRR